MKTYLWRQAICAAEMDTTAKLIAHTLSAHMNAAGDTFVGKETLRREAGFTSTRTVDLAIQRLEAAGFLLIVRSKGGHPNHYLATTPTPHGDAGCTPHGDAGFDSSNPASDDIEPRISRHRTPHGDAPEVVSTEIEVLEVERSFSLNETKESPEERKRRAELIRSSTHLLKDVP